MLRRYTNTENEHNTVSKLENLKFWCGKSKKKMLFFHRNFFFYIAHTINMLSISALQVGYKGVISTIFESAVGGNASGSARFFAANCSQVTKICFCAVLEPEEFFSCFGGPINVAPQTRLLRLKTRYSLLWPYRTTL